MRRPPAKRPPRTTQTPAAPATAGSSPPRRRSPGGAGPPAERSRPAPARSGLSRILVSPEHQGLRVDQLLAQVTTLSRRKARELIAQGLVWRNQQPLRILSREVELADVVDVLMPARDLGIATRPEHPEVHLLHEDPWLLIAAKPAGVLSQPKEDMEAGELALDQQLMLALAARDGRPPFLRMVHRLDRLTSGAVLFAGCKAALAPLSRLWRQGRVERVYVAVVEGHVEQDLQEIELAIARDPSHAWRFRTSTEGRPARTRVRVVERQEGATIVICELITGRTHQVRVHLAAIGHPVLGDRLYAASIHATGPTSSSAAAASRPLLHAARLTLPHPRDGHRLRITCPVPSDLRPWIGDIERLLEPATGASMAGPDGSPEPPGQPE